MEAIKIQNYERENGLGTFVPFHHLSEDEADHIFELLRRRLGLANSLSATEVVKTIRAKSMVVEGVDAESDSFNLKQLLEKLHFNVCDTVYLNWYRFDKIDEFRIHDLFKVFGDVWYPSSDDLDIFDSSLDWLVSIEHSGAIRAMSVGKF